MSYTILSKKKTDRTNWTEDDAVELGLSVGELRQSILDRVRNGIEEKHFSDLVSFIQPLGVNVTSTKVNKNTEELIVEVENKIYNTEVLKFLNNPISFYNETIKIIEKKD